MTEIVISECALMPERAIQRAAEPDRFDRA